MKFRHEASGVVIEISDNATAEQKRLIAEALMVESRIALDALGKAIEETEKKVYLGTCARRPRK